MQNWLISGDYNALCDSCGRKFKASTMRKRWDGLMVCSEDYEQRHPSDFLRVQKEKIAVPWSRPYGTDSFVGVCTPEGSSGIAGYAVAGCSIARKPYVPIVIPVTRDNMPPYCTIGSIQPLADIGTADCATIGFK